jgi:phage terminase small subunit
MLNNRQIAAKRLLTAVLRKSGAYTSADGFLVIAAACLYVELNTLQRDVNTYGTTYLVKTTAGDLVSKHRPEHQQLNEARSKFLQMLKELGATPAARKRVATTEVELDPLAELLASK